MTPATVEMKQHVARCGMLFMDGEPPPGLDHLILVYTGGCNALVANWDKRRGKYVGYFLGSKYELTGDHRVDCWMYLPHQAIWPTVDAPANLIPERSLYNDYDGDVFSHAASPFAGKCGEV